MSQQQIVVEGVADGRPFAANYAASGWMVDNGYLHVIGEAGKGNVATYAPGYWAFVSRAIADGAPNEREVQMAVTP